MFAIISLCMLPVILSAQVPWYHNTTIYQIYPRSYYDTDGDGIGDLEGIIQKLDYIKTTGFETIWISPFFLSPQRDHGYDISDYLSIDPVYGDLETVQRLINEVHQRDMKIVFDMVLNHTSDQHPWFVESASSRDNPKADWYIWADGVGKGPPNNWKSMIGGSSWHYSPARDQYYYSAFLPFQPDLNYRNPEVKQKMFETVSYWLETGVDGFRLDIFNAIMEDEQLRNNPFSTTLILTEDRGFFQHMKHTLNNPQNMEFAEQLRAVMDSFSPPERFLLGEVFGDYQGVKDYLGDGQDRLHLAFLFDMLNFDFDAEYFKRKLEEREQYFPEPYIPVYVFSNHDRKRSISRIGNDVAKAKILAAFQLTARGVPVIYMGEEIGMTQAKIPLDEGQDPLAEKFSWLPQFLVNLSSESLNRDECRTPMQWNSEINAGFSTADTTWLAVRDDYLATNVSASRQDSSSLWQVVHQLLILRKQYSALSEGKLEMYEDTPKGVLGYRRIHDENQVLVLLNYCNKTKKVQLPYQKGQILFTTHKGHTYSKKIKLAPFEAILVSLSTQ